MVEFAPAPSSWAGGSWIVRVGKMTLVLLIVAVAVAFAIVALVGVDSVIVNVALPGLDALARSVMGIVWVVTPGAKVSEPVAAV